MSTTLRTLDDAKAALGRRLMWDKSEAPMEVTSFGVKDRRAWVGLGQHENPDGREVVAPAVIVYLPATLGDDADQRDRIHDDRMTDGDLRIPPSCHEPHVSRMATWEGSVLPALREALDEYLETRGADLTHRLHEGNGMLTAEVRRPGQWVTTKAIRLGCHQYMTQDIAVLVALAVDCALEHEASKGSEPPPRSGVDHTARAMLAALQPEPSRSVEEAAAVGPVISAVQSAVSETLATCEKAAMDAAASLGLPASALVDERTGRTPLPEGWTWDAAFLCCANGNGNAYAILEDMADLADEDEQGRIFTNDGEPAPTAVHNALVREARRLGLVCHEVERVEASAPEGYTFREDPSGIVVRPSGGCMPNGEAVQYYWRRGASTTNQNANPHRWVGHEAARQWAAHLLGETAPPLDTPSDPWTPKAGDRVRLPDLERAEQEDDFVPTMRRLCGLVGTVRDVGAGRGNGMPGALVSVGDDGWWWALDSLRPA